MYFFSMFIRCSDRFLEVIPDELEMTRITVEHLIDQILHDLFHSVALENVIVYPCARELSQRAYYTIDISAQCSALSVPDLAHEIDKLELTLEDRISCILIELFGTVYVERVSVKTK